MRRLIRVLLGATVLMLGSISGASAGVPNSVDQGALQPPLNQAFTYRCFETGGGILCQGLLDDAWFGEDSGLTCGDRVIYTTGSGHERLSRWHLSDGRATRTIVQLHYDEVWSLSPSGSGPSIRVRGDWNRHYVYPVPGDRSARVLTEVGSVWKATAPGFGVVAQDAGFIQYAPGRDYDEASALHGPKDFWNDFDGAIGKICAVLETTR